MSANKFAHPEILVELLKMRAVPEDQAKVAANLFTELINDPTWGGWVPKGEPVKASLPDEPEEETLNDFIRELLERALLLPVQMFLERLPDEQRDRLRKKIVL